MRREIASVTRTAAFLEEQRKRKMLPWHNGHGFQSQQVCSWQNLILMPAEGLLWMVYRFGGLVCPKMGVPLQQTWRCAWRSDNLVAESHVSLSLGAGSTAVLKWFQWSWSIGVGQADRYWAPATYLCYQPLWPAHSAFNWYTLMFLVATSKQEQWQCSYSRQDHGGYASRMVPWRHARLWVLQI